MERTAPLAAGVADPAALRPRQHEPELGLATYSAGAELESIVPGSWDRQKLDAGGYVAPNGDSREAIEAYEKRQFRLSDGSIEGRDVPCRPWSGLCYLALDFGSVQMVGTGCLIGPRTVLTAAHNLYSREHRRPASSITIVPGRFREGQEPFGSIVSQEFAFEQRYRAADDSRAATQFDYGVIFLPDNKLAKLAGFTYGFMSLEDWFWLDAGLGWINIAGFPAEQPQLMWAKGKPRRLDGNVVVHDIDTTPGQSGSPIYWTDGAGNYRVLGVHTDGTGFDAKLNAGVRITADIAAQLKGWCETPGPGKDVPATS